MDKKTKEHKTEHKKKKVDDKFQKQITEKDAKIADLTDTLQRLQAETENYKKRCDKSVEDFKEYSVASFIEKLLPILDSFGLALKNTATREQFIKGVELIYGQLYDMIEKDA